MTPEQIVTAVLEPGLVKRVAPLASADGILSKLPLSYRQLLSQSDGLMAYGGYYRIFGLGPSNPISLSSWNDTSTWKFAWPNHLSDYLCFAESGFGDQYAIRYDELGDKAPVYLMHMPHLEPEPHWRNFDEFLGAEFLGNARDPYDQLVVETRRKFGDLALEEHVAYSPSPLITGDESITNVLKMPAIASMIVDGDLASQLSGQDGRSLERLEVTSDDAGRMRLRVVWAS